MKARILDLAGLDHLEGRPLRAGELLRLHWPDGSTTEGAVDLVEGCALVRIAVRGIEVVVRPAHHAIDVERVRPARRAGPAPHSKCARQLEGGKPCGHKFAQHDGGPCKSVPFAVKACPCPGFVAAPARAAKGSEEQVAGAEMARDALGGIEGWDRGVTGRHWTGAQK